MTSIEKEIVIFDKAFDLMRVFNDENGVLKMTYRCKEFTGLECHFEEDQTTHNTLYWFYFDGSNGCARKTTVEAFDNLYKLTNEGLNRSIKNTNYNITSCEKNLIKEKEKLDELKKYLVVVEEMYKKCKSELVIKDIIE